MVYFFQFIIGVLLLYYGADLLINSSKSVSYILGIPKIIVGITIIAFGTSLPELFVSIIAMVKNESEICLCRSQEMSKRNALFRKAQDILEKNGNTMEGDGIESKKMIDNGVRKILHGAIEIATSFDTCTR